MTAFQSLFADHGDSYMPFPANTPTIDDLTGLGLQDIAQLPVELLAILQRDVDERLKRDKAAKARLDGALTVRYATRAAEERQAAGKDTGTIRFDDGNFTVVANLPKQVDWDQDRLAVMVERIRAAGDVPRAACAATNVRWGVRGARAGEYPGHCGRWGCSYVSKSQFMRLDLSFRRSVRPVCRVTFRWVE